MMKQMNERLNYSEIAIHRNFPAIFGYSWLHFIVYVLEVNFLDKRYHIGLILVWLGYQFV